MICPTCKQNMNDPPRIGNSGKDCPQCGQGLNKTVARHIFKSKLPRMIQAKKKVTGQQRAMMLIADVVAAQVKRELRAIQSRGLPKEPKGWKLLKDAHWDGFTPTKNAICRYADKLRAYALALTKRRKR